MAIYHLSATVISRSQGRSSTAASAYPPGEKIVDERTGLMHYYTKKSDVINNEILLPENAPAWMSNREKLWNAVEQTEKRKDAQVAREINVALPRELNDEQNWDLLKTFVQHEFVDKGMVADVAFHRGHTGNEEQPHGHIMLSLREVTKDGFGLKQREWNDKALLNSWREQWACLSNRELAKAGFDIRIDNRTLEAQGIDLEAQSKIGAKAAAERMARLAEHQALAQRNGERLLREPEIALTALTRQQSTFTERDIARFVNRHTVDEAQFEAVYEKVKTHPELVSLGKDDQGNIRLTTRDLLALETQMIAYVQEKARSGTHMVSESRALNAMASKGLSDEQQVALKHLTQGPDIACVVGFAGTGKSYMLGAAKEAWEAQGFRVQGMTLSGIAAENLEAGAGIESFTVANRLWRWERDMARLTRHDVVVVDEAGMLGSRQMARIMAEVDRAGAKVVLVGDPEQLQAIEAGAAYRAIAERVGAISMVDIRRQSEPWQQQATRDFASEHTKDAMNAYEQHDNVHTFNTKEDAITGMIEQWDEVRSQSLEQSQIMLAYTRDEVLTLNEQARLKRREANELGQDVTIEAGRGQRTFASGDRIYFMRNETRELNVKNGTLGTIEKIDEQRLQVRLDSSERAPSRVVEFSLKEYNDIEYGYAATVYKAQGVTVDRAHVLASKYFDRHSTYVAMSRHREGADLYVSREEFPSFAALGKSLSRERTKDVTLDYAGERGFDVGEIRRISDRRVEQQRDVSTTLTPDRLEQARKRLVERQCKNAISHDYQRIQKETGLSLSTELREGDKGIYRGTVEIGSQRYGIMEQEERQGKLIPLEQLSSRKMNKAMVIEKQTNSKGHEQLKGIQPRVQERSQQRSKGYEMEL